MSENYIVNEHELIDAYRRTSYWVESSEVSIRIRVGELNPLLDKLLDDHDVVEWGYVTAANPASRICSDEDNRKAHAELRREILALGCKILPGHGTGDDGAWPSEQSLLILGIDRGKAKSMGERFGQKAIVVGQISRPAELVILEL